MIPCGQFTAMKLEQERQKKEQEMRRRIQLAQEAEARKQAERQQQESLMSKDRLVQQQGELLAKPLPINLSKPQVRERY